VGAAIGPLLPWDSHRSLTYRFLVVGQDAGHQEQWGFCF
jgi:hypothetical protein